MGQARAVYEGAPSSPAETAMPAARGQPLDGGALDLGRLIPIIGKRAEAEAALGSSARSKSGRQGIDITEFAFMLPDDHIALQAARLLLAASAALATVAADDAEQAQLGASFAALLTDETAAQRERAIAAHELAVQEANRRGLLPPPFERPEPIRPDAQFSRRIVVDFRKIRRGPADPRGYLEPHEHSLLDVRERRTTLQAERRDLERLKAAAEARIAATMQEVADLVEQVYDGCQPVHIRGFADLGPAYSACCKLRALTTEDYAWTIWGRAVPHWKWQIEGAE